MRFCWLLLLIWVPTRPIQAQISISARVVSGVERRPVAYATVGVAGQSRGVYAGEQGRFTLDGLRPDGSLRVSSVGYRTRTIRVSELGTPPEIGLDEVPVELAEVFIRREGGTLRRVGAQGSKDTRHSLVAGDDRDRQTEYVLLLPGSVDSATTYLRSIGFFISSHGKPKAPFRVRVYSVKAGQPDQDLLSRSLVTAARRGSAWHEVDVREFNLRVPPEGAFVGMEWLYGAHSKFFYQITFSPHYPGRSGSEVRVNYGQSLMLTDEFGTLHTYQRHFGGNWSPFAPPFFKNFANAMIRAEYLVYE